MMLHYRVSPATPEAREYALELTIPQPHPDGQVVTMAAWTPGSYMVRDHARHVTWIEAEDASGQAVELEWLDKQSWRAAPCVGALTLRWRVHAHELSVRTAHLDSLWGFADAAALWLRPLGLESVACQVEVLRSSSVWAQDWRAASMLSPEAIDADGYGRYVAADVEALLDAPLAFGALRELSFSVRGVVHRFAWLGRVEFDTARLAADLARACAAVVALFGVEPPPFARYLFLALVTADGYGGLEHREGTALLCRAEHFPRVGEAATTPAYREFLGLCAHEYLHAWLVKRIRPAALMPQPDGRLPLQAEAYTRLLWLFEGVTSYYDDLLLLRAGLISLADYLDTLASTISRVQRAPGRERLTLEQASLTAWTRLYKADENTPNASVSYYTKGALFAWVLDMALRERSADRVSLDDVLRALWRDFGLRGRGVPEHVDDWLIATTGVDVADVLQAGLRGCAELPLADTAAALGLSLRRGTAQDTPSMGAELRSGERGEARVGTVYRGQAAERAGLAPRDELLAINGLRVNRANLDVQLRRYAVGETLVLHVFRRDELRVLELVLQEPLPTEARLASHNDSTPVQRVRLERWTQG
ncbi:MAG: PDZ domain-containing protein [Halothiobacillaceae bacterium]|nr:PDZ domain-containing protein [Halothiobacillaceae bacterium]